MTGVGPNTADLLHRPADPQFLFLKGSVSDFSFDGASGGPLPSEFLTGYSAAAGIALINSVGNLGGFVAPVAIGLVIERSGTRSASLALAAGPVFVAATLVLLLPKKVRRLAIA
jgi:nitrate/nitrite transporter NarK